MEGVITQVEFDNILRNYTLSTVLTSDEKSTLYMFLVENNFDAARFKGVLNGAKKYAIAVQKQNKFIDSTDVKFLIMDMCKTADARVYEQFNMIDKQLKQYYKDNGLNYPKGLDRLMKAIYQKAKEINEQNNQEFETFSEKTIDFIYSFACIYSSLAEFLDTRPVSEVITNLDEKDKFLSMLDYLLVKKILNLGVLRLNHAMLRKDTFKDFLNELTNGQADKNELFTSEDVFRLLEHSPSIIDDVTREKLVGIRAVLKDYFAQVCAMAKKENSADLKKIEEFTTKDLFLRGGTILIRDPDNVKDTINFLFGYKISDVLEASDKKGGKKYQQATDELRKNFPNLRLTGMDSSKHLQVLNHSSLFTTMHIENINSVASGVVENLYSAILGESEASISEKVETLRAAGFNVDYLFTGDNINEFFNQFSIKAFSDKQSKAYKIVNKNVRMLSSLMSTSDIQKIFSHNLYFVMQDSEKLVEILNKTIAQSGNAEKLKLNVESLINTRVIQNIEAYGEKDKVNKGSRKPKNSGLNIEDDVKQEINLDELSLDLDKLGEFGIDVPLDLTLGTEIQESVKEIEPVRQTKVEQIIEEVEETLPSPNVRNAETCYELINDYLESIEFSLKEAASYNPSERAKLLKKLKDKAHKKVLDPMTGEEREVIEISTISSVRAKVNQVELLMRELNKNLTTDDTEFIERERYNIASRLRTIDFMLSNVGELYQQSVRDVQTYIETKSDKIKQKESIIARRAAQAIEAQDLAEQLGSVYESFGLMLDDVKDLIKVAQVTFNKKKQRADEIAAARSIQAERQEKKTLLREAYDDYEATSSTKHSLEKLKNVLNTFGEIDVEKLKKKREKLIIERDKIEAEIKSKDGVIESKWAELRGKYSSEHLKDENYSTSHMAKLKKALENVEEQKKKLEKDLAKIEAQIIAIDKLIIENESGFKL